MKKTSTFLTNTVSFSGKILVKVRPLTRSGTSFQMAPKYQKKSILQGHFQMKKYT